MLAIVKDITDRKKAEELLLLKNAAIDSSINGICITDLDGILTYVNPAFLSIWGGSDTNEILGKSILPQLPFNKRIIAFNRIINHLQNYYLNLF